MPPDQTAGPNQSGPNEAGPNQPGPNQSGPNQAPDAAAVAAAANMSDDQRQAMIRTMVASLAAKQAADPSNLDGWLRLGRAYTVLHEPEKAADAYEKAAALKPGDVSIPLLEVRALLSDHAPADKLPIRVIGLLKHVEATDPEQPLVSGISGWRPRRTLTRTRLGATGVRY